jgi:DNA-binding transcriptional regulator YhcF (GntR family)
MKPTHDAFIVVDQSQPMPPFAQIFEQIRAAIQRGELEPGAPLPTVRALSRDLGVAPNTVARAYADLQIEGWIESEGRRGTCVAGVPPISDARARRSALREAVARFIDSLVVRGYRESEIAEEVRRALP